jgi:hypothetical protein
VVAYPYERTQFRAEVCDKALWSMRKPLTSCRVITFPPSTKVNPLMRIEGEFDLLAAGILSRKKAFPLITVFPMPAPIMLKPLPLMVIALDHVADPADTLIVSPLLAFFTQLCMLERSGVEVQVGLDPVHAAIAGDAIKKRENANALRKAQTLGAVIRLILIGVNVLDVMPC